MKKILTGICNGLMAASIRQILQSNHDFCVFSLEDDIASWVDADIALLEVACNPGFTTDERLRQVRTLRSVNDHCRILLLCDENSTPELARKVAMAKKDGLIDDFVYSSVSERYLTAMLHAL